MKIDGYNVEISIGHVNNITANDITGFLKNNTPFVLHDGDKIGPVFIPEKLACIDRGGVLIHSGESEFLFSLSFQMGLYECASRLESDAITYFENKLLN